MSRFWKTWDWLLVSNVLLLVIFGLVTIYSLRFNNSGTGWSIFIKQLVFVVIGLMLFFLISKLHYRWASLYYKIFYIVAIVLLVAVLFFGVTINGHKGWLSFLGQSFQPVEFAKLALIVWLSRYYGEHLDDLRVWRTLFFGALVSFILIALVMRQPDFGSAAILLIIWAALSFFLVLPKKFYWQAAAVVGVILIVGWFGLAQYQKDRLLTFVNPQVDPQGSSYNVRQAMIAVGSGQLIGRGFTLGSQSQLNFLPEPETDFIFSVVGEVLGFFGTGILALLFFVLLWRLLLFGSAATDPFGSLLLIGIFIYFFTQVAINISMNIGLAPVVGIPLPLISAGGTSMLVSLTLLGLAHSVRLHQLKSNY